jgi:hypothetical protein
MHALVFLHSLFLTLALADGPASQPAPTEPRVDGVSDSEAPSSMPARKRTSTTDADAPSSMPARQGASQADGEAPSSMPAASGPMTTAPARETTPEPPPPPLIVDEARATRVLTAGGVTSRPGVTESARLLLRGAGLLSIGMAAEASLDDTFLVAGNRLVAPDLTLRYAILDGVEIRAATTGEVQGTLAPGIPSLAGFTRFSLGSSVAVLESSAWYMPDVALLMSLGIPVRTLRVDDVTVEARAMAAWTLLERITLAGNLGAGFDGVTNQFTFPYTVQIAFDIGGGLGAFGETFGRASLAGLPDLWVDGGIYYDVGTLVRIDMSAGLQPFGTFAVIGDRAWFVGVGASVLLPGHLAMFGGAH